MMRVTIQYEIYLRAILEGQNAVATHDCLDRSRLKVARRHTYALVPSAILPLIPTVLLLHRTPVEFCKSWSVLIKPIAVGILNFPPPQLFWFDFIGYLAGASLQRPHFLNWGRHHTHFVGRSLFLAVVPVNPAILAGTKTSTFVNTLDAAVRRLDRINCAPCIVGRFYIRAAHEFILFEIQFEGVVGPGLLANAALAGIDLGLGRGEETRGRAYAFVPVCPTIAVRPTIGTRHIALYATLAHCWAPGGMHAKALARVKGLQFVPSLRQRNLPGELTLATVLGTDIRFGIRENMHLEIGHYLSGLWHANVPLGPPILSLTIARLGII
jgi:hypothetical protein